MTDLRSAGYAAWLNKQIAQDVGPTGWDWLNDQGYANAADPARFFDNFFPGDYMLWNQLLTGPDAPRKRLALALSELFVVSLSSLNLSWRSQVIAAYWDLLCKHAFGNYRDLLEAVTLNMAMGFFLNTSGNKKADGKGSAPDENYAREVMQLFTIGLVALNLDGTPRLLNGQTIDTYGANDVSQLAQVFTGYAPDKSQNISTTITSSSGATQIISGLQFARLPMVQVGSNHSTLECNFLGANIPAGATPAAALKTALDTLFNHANTAPFVCKQLIQRLVTSNPSSAYVKRVASVFVNNGAGVRGDLAAVYTAVLRDAEARGPAGLTGLEFGKLREPMLRLVQWGRTFGVASTSGKWELGNLSNNATSLGQSPLRAESVFNFFRPGYVPPGVKLSVSAVAPEFQLVNEISVSSYLNFLQGMIANGLNSGNLKATYLNELALVTDATALVVRLNLLLCAGQLSVANQTLIVAALNATSLSATSTPTLKNNRIYAAVLLVMASADYLVQK